MRPSEIEFVDALCRTKFDAFAERAFHTVNPNTAYEWNWHIGCISEHLTALYDGDIRRLIINLPPRSLKSYLVSSAFAAWVMGKNPSAKFINTGYGSTVVEQNARNCRMIMRDLWYQNLFPATRINPDMDRIMHFETTKRGQYYADTALSTITGVGCQYMQIDDPIKPMEAFSDTVRTSTNNNIRATLMNRFDDKRIGRLMLVMQRVHEDDTTGNLLKDGGYVHVKLPAEAKSQIVIKLKDMEWRMEPGDLLFPQRLSRAELDRTRQDMTELNYVGQFLQEPVAIGGGEFKDEWVQYYGAGACKPATMNLCILVDPAGGEELNKKKKKLSDWTAMMVVGLGPDNNYYLLDAIRDRLNPTERVNTLFLLHRKWNEISGKSPKVGYERYGMMSDLHYIEEKKRQDAYNFPLVELGGQMMKEERIRKLIPDMQNGRWYFPQSLIYVDGEGRRFDLVSEIVKSEMATFPRARFDDMCFVAGTKIITKGGEKNIEKLKRGDLVLTPDGYKPVVNCISTGMRKTISKFGITATPNHPVFSLENGYVALDTLSSNHTCLGVSLCDWIKIALLKSLSSTASLIVGWEEAVNTIYPNIKITKTGNMPRACMLQFGNFIREKRFLLAMRLIIKIAIHSIASMKIWSVYRAMCITEYLKRSICKKSAKTSGAYDRLLPRGINRPKEGNGIQIWLRERVIKSFSSVPKSVWNAVKNLLPRNPEELCIAAIYAGIEAGKEHIEDLGATRLNANYVGNQELGLMPGVYIAPWHAATKQEEDEVFNLSVADAKCYYANGILVHNCDALSRIYTPELNMVFPKLKIGTVAKARRQAAMESEAQSWEDM